MTKTVTGDGRRSPGWSRRSREGVFPVTLADYSIRKPRYLGIGVKDIVKVEVAFAVSR